MSSTCCSTGPLRAIDALFMTHVMPEHDWDQPLLFGIWYVKSTLVMLLGCFIVIPRADRGRHLAIIPFYAFYALLSPLPVTLGYINQLSLRLTGRRIYIDHYMPAGADIAVARFP